MCVVLENDSIMRALYMNKASIYKYIENRKALIECAACRIEIFEKSGNEHISYDALSELRSVTTILGMERSITHDLPKGIIITDDVYPIRDCNSFKGIFEALINNDVELYFYVEKENVELFRNYVWDEARKLTQYNALLNSWEMNELSHILQFRKLITTGFFIYLIRIYEDGSGLLIYHGMNSDVYEFSLPSSNKEEFINGIITKIDNILRTPSQRWLVDDRYMGYSVHEKYNIYWRNPDADSLINDDYVYENILYYDNESDSDVFRYLENIDIVNKHWMKLHTNEKRPIVRDYEVIESFMAGTSTVLSLDKEIDWLAGDYIIIGNTKYRCIRNSVPTWIILPDTKLEVPPTSVTFVNDG